MSSESSRLDARTARSVVVIFVAVAAAYGPVLGAGFVWDDAFQVLQNPWIRTLTGPGAAFTHDLAGFLPGYETPYYRPLIHVLHAALYAVAGPAPAVFHIANVVLHALVSVAVLALASRGEERSGPALLAGLIFALHPLHVEPVAWVTAVIEIGYTLATLLAVLVLVRGRASLLPLVPILFAVALLWKETGIVLLPVTLLWLLTSGRLRAEPLRSWGVLLSMLAVLGLYLVLRANALGGLLARTRPGRVPAADAVLTGVAAGGHYMLQLVAPWPLTPLCDFALVTSAADPRFVWGVACVVGLAFAAYHFRDDANIVLGIALLVLPLLPALYVPGLKDALVADRYLYLPVAGLALLVSSAWRRRPELDGNLVPRAVVAGVLVLMAGATFFQARVWRDELTLWTHAADQAPGSAIANEYAGAALLRAGRLDDAVPVLARAVGLDSTRLDATINLSIALTSTGRPAEALIQAERASALRPTNANALAALAWALAGAGRLDEAALACERALAVAPQRADLHALAGGLHGRAGRMREAAAEYREALRLEPGNPDHLANLQRTGEAP